MKSKPRRRSSRQVEVRKWLDPEVWPRILNALSHLIVAIAILVFALTSKNAGVVEPLIKSLISSFRSR